MTTPTAAVEKLDGQLDQLLRVLSGDFAIELYQRTLVYLGADVCQKLFDGASVASEAGLNGRTDLEAESYAYNWIQGLEQTGS